MSSGRRAAIAAAAAVLVAPAVAAARPTLSGPEASFGAGGGVVLVHYTTTGVDAVPAADTDTSGVPDFVEQVATIAEEAMTLYAADGFRAAKSDVGAPDNGGDARVDLYLRNLNQADGNVTTDGCAGGTCIAYGVTENDFAGFGYPSVTEAIRSVIPHELFHILQYAYSDDQPAQWNEGTAVWATEHLYGDGNSDFERFLDDFLTRTYRPFDRDTGGFGDLYMYGAALFPYFLEQYAGVPDIVAVFDATVTDQFLDAVDATLAGGLAATFTEFTRWNLFTGSRSAGGMYPGADGWAEAPLETPLVATAPDLGVETTIQIEGMSARYVPVSLGDAGAWRITVRQSGRMLRAWIVPTDGDLAGGVELMADGDDLVAELPDTAARDHYLVVTGLSRNTITTAIPVVLEPFVDDGGGGGGCCSAGGDDGSGALVLVLGVGVGVMRRRRRAR